MSTVTLISGPQGSGKTRIVTTLVGENQNIIYFDGLTSKKIRQTLLLETESEEKVVIDEVYFKHDRITAIIEYCRFKQKDLILITNDPVFLFNGLDIDQCFEIKTLKIEK